MVHPDAAFLPPPGYEAAGARKEDPHERRSLDKRVVWLSWSPLWRPKGIIRNRLWQRCCTRKASDCILKKAVENKSPVDRDNRLPMSTAPYSGFQQQGAPIILVDCKEDLIGNFKNSGRESPAKGERHRVDCMTFSLWLIAKRSPMASMIWSSDTAL